MRQLKKIMFYNVLFSIILFTGCSGVFVGNNTNKSLPVVNEIRALPDVTSIALEWTPISNPSQIQGFILRELKSDGKVKNIATIKNPHATHYVIKSLTPETNYTFQILTIGKDNSVSAFFRSISVKTSFIDPVETVIASVGRPKMIKLIWNPHPNPSVIQYTIQRKNKDGKFSNIATIKDRLLVEYFDENLLDATSYSYRIIAHDINGAKSRISQIAVGRTRERPKPLQNIRASTNLPKRIQLQWNKVEGIQKYYIYASSEKDGRFSFLGTSNQNFYVDKVQQDSFVRFYRIAAVDDAEIIGEMPQQIVGRTLPPLPVPKIVLRGIQGNFGLIQWEAINNQRVKAYAVYRSEGKGKTLRFMDMTQTKFIDKEMQRGKKYTYWVVAIDNEKNESAPSQRIELELL